MALLDFRCEDCGTEFEELVRADSLPTCPSCGSAKTTRRWTPGFRTLKYGLRGKAARESNSRRAEREARRKER